jgi:predicted metal-dependent phosphoesterase TrpH
MRGFHCHGTYSECVQDVNAVHWLAFSSNVEVIADAGLVDR